MRNETGGSSHDPGTALPAPFWDRQSQRLPGLCGMCGQSPDRDLRSNRKHGLAVAKGPAPSVYTMCNRCDVADKPKD